MLGMLSFNLNLLPERRSFLCNLMYDVAQSNENVQKNDGKSHAHSTAEQGAGVDIRYNFKMASKLDSKWA